LQTYWVSNGGDLLYQPILNTGEQLLIMLKLKMLLQIVVVVPHTAVTLTINPKLAAPISAGDKPNVHNHLFRL
jgi:hypothetical protein